MTQYNDLSDGEKHLCKKIEDIFKYHPSISREMFCKILFLLANKYKKRGN